MRSAVDEADHHRDAQHAAQQVQRPAHAQQRARPAPSTAPTPAPAAARTGRAAPPPATADSAATAASAPRPSARTAATAASISRTADARRGAGAWIMRHYRRPCAPAARRSMLVTWRRAISQATTAHALLRRRFRSQHPRTHQRRRPGQPRADHPLRLQGRGREVRAGRQRHHPVRAQRIPAQADDRHPARAPDRAADRRRAAWSSATWRPTWPARARRSPSSRASSRSWPRRSSPRSRTPSSRSKRRSTATSCASPARSATTCRTAMALLKKTEFELPLQFDNFRD